MYLLGENPLLEVDVEKVFPVSLVMFKTLGN